MNETKRAILIVLEAALFVGMMFAWLPDPAQPPTTGIWVLRWGLLAAIAVNLCVIVWAFRQRDRVPDFLRQLRQRPFERSGVLFSISPAIRDEVAYLNVAFQNRFSRSCDFRLVLTPSSRRGEEAPTPTDVIVDCSGGMLGVVRVPVGVPAAFQGKIIRFRITADVRYLGGAGAMLLSRSGQSVGQADREQLPLLAIIGLAMMTGHVHLLMHTSANIRLAFHGPVREVLSSEIEPSVETHWLPGESLDGVPAALSQALRGE